MRKFFILLVMVLFVFGVAITYAEQAEQKQPAKTKEVLQLELQVLQNQRESKVNEFNRYLIQVEYLKLKVPDVQVEIQELDAQIRQKVSEVRALDNPAEKKK